MNGYSKINAAGSNKARSIDFFDLFSSQTPKSASIAQEPNQIKINATKGMENEDSSADHKQEDDDNGRRFSVTLSRNASVSATTSTSLQSSLKRAFSMRRSSSVSERYCRIHDQCVVLPSSIEDEEGASLETLQRTRSVKKTKPQRRSKSKILNACKRLLGL